MPSDDTRDWMLPGPDALVLSLKQVAAMFQVKPRTIQRWIERGEFPQGRGDPPLWTGADMAAYLHLRGRLSINPNPEPCQNATNDDTE